MSLRWEDMGTCTDFMCNFFFNSSHIRLLKFGARSNLLCFVAILPFFLTWQHEHIHVPTDEANTPESLTLVPFLYFASIQLLKRMTFFRLLLFSSRLMRRYSAGNLSMAENLGCQCCYKKKGRLLPLCVERWKQCSTWSIWGRLFSSSLSNKHKEPDYNMNWDKKNA